MVETEKNPLVDALRRAETEQNAGVPSEEAVEHTFSDGFRQKMDRLVRAQRQPGWEMVKTPVRRSFLLLLVLLLTFGVRPDRNPLFRVVQPIPQLSTSVPSAAPTEAASLPGPAAPSGGPAQPRYGRAEIFRPEDAAPAAPSGALPEPSAAASAAPDRPETVTVPASPAGDTAAPPAAYAPSEDTEPAGSPEQAADAPDRQEGWPVYVPITEPADPAESDSSSTQEASSGDGTTDWIETITPPVPDIPVPWGDDYAGSLLDSLNPGREPASVLPELPTVRIFY